MRSTIHLLIAILLLFGLAPITPSAAAGVVGTGTPASCTDTALRAAVALGGSITFRCGPAMHTITLSDDLLVDKDTSIDGGGTDQGGMITLSGGGATRVILTATFARLTVRNVTIIDGKEPGADGRGGAIFGGWRCPVTIINSVLRNNDGTAGDQEGGGGAVFVHETQLLVQSSRFESNRGINGGAINNLLSVLTVEDSLFLTNDSTPGATSAQGHGYGGAIYTDGATWPTNDAIGGQISIRRSQFIGNHGAGQGGAVFGFVFFFFAYNWDGMHRFVKLALPAVAVAVAGGFALWRGLERLEGQVALFVACALIGTLQAVFGQVYQTGANSFMLFASWAALIITPTLLARNAPLWMLLLALLNLSLFLFLGQSSNIDTNLSFTAMFALNSGWLLGWELGRARAGTWMASPWYCRVGLALAAGWGTLITIQAITGGWTFSAGDLPLLGGTLAALLLGGVATFYYRWRTPDLPALSMLALCTIILVTFQLARWFIWDSALSFWDSALSFFFYYNLDLTLLKKSLSLMTSGVALLVAWAALGWLAAGDKGRRA